MQAIRDPAFTTRGVDPGLPRPATAPDRPQTTLGIKQPGAVTHHALRERRNLNRTGLVNAHAGTGSRGSTGAGIGAGDGTGVAGAGNLSGSTMIGTDLPGSPTRWNLTRATRQPPEGIATALVAGRSRDARDPATSRQSRTVRLEIYAAIVSAE